tara:strand:+ start:68 stop:793 length:726 start_codon:yes stop_codon:yes gene_type:complete
MVEEFFANYDIDVVIHCAISGGRRGQPECPKMFYDNVKMFENLASQRDKFDLMINFGSGAEMDRTRDIMLRKEEDFLSEEQLPSDYYGFSKYIIAKRIQQINDNICNFRIFNVFGELEKQDRMIKNNLTRFRSNLPLQVHQNKIMDFFSVEDLYRVVRYYLDNFLSFSLDKDLNMCYTNKVDLKQVCKIICSDDEYKIDICDEGMSPAYCGNGERLRSLEIDLLGLEKSIRKLQANNETDF